MYKTELNKFDILRFKPGTEKKSSTMVPNVFYFHSCLRSASLEMTKHWLLVKVLVSV